MYSVLRECGGTPIFCGDLRKMVGATGFEPATPCAQGRCATRLRYAPTQNPREFYRACERELKALSQNSPETTACPRTPVSPTPRIPSIFVRLSPQPR